MCAVVVEQCATEAHFTTRLFRQDLKWEVRLDIFVSWLSSTRDTDHTAALRKRFVLFWICMTSHCLLPIVLNERFLWFNLPKAKVGLQQWRFNQRTEH